MEHNVWSDHQIKAADHAKRVALHYKKAAEYYETGQPDKAIHHALQAISHIDYSSRHAHQANRFCFKTMLYDLLEY
jgi:hypothetical protein